MGKTIFMLNRALLSVILAGLTLDASFAMPGVLHGEIASNRVQDCLLCQLPSDVIEKEIVPLLTLADIKNLRATSQVARQWCVGFLAGIKARRGATRSVLAEEPDPSLQRCWPNARILAGTELQQFLKDLKVSGHTLAHLKDFTITAIYSPDLLTVCLQSLNSHAEDLDLSSVNINLGRKSYLMSLIDFHVRLVRNLLTFNWSKIQSQFHFEEQSAVMRALSTYDKLQKLTLECGFLDSRDALSIAIVLSEHASRVRSLRLWEAQLLLPEMCILAPTLRSFSVLEDLDLTGANLCEGGAMHLATVFSAVAAHLRALNLSFVTLGSAQMRMLAPALESLSRLEHLELRGIYTDEDAQSVRLFCEVFSKVGPQLVFLNLSRAHSGGRSLKQIASGLRGLTRLQSLDLSANDLSSQDIWLWESILPGIAGLENLNLAHNYIDAIGARHLNRALMVLPRLRSVNLIGNRLGEEGLECLVPALTGLTTLRELAIDSTFHGQDGARVLAYILLGLPGQLQILDIGNNFLGPEGLRRLESALISQTRLQQLSLCGNELGLQEEPILVSILSKLEGLQEVDLTGNELRIYRKLRPVEALKSLQNW
jgi:Ran GTPase-activating protein (RanGAP) involved in mRNA processing and transport